MERVRLPRGYPAPGSRHATTRPPGRQRPKFASRSFLVEDEPQVRVLVKNDTSQELQYKIETRRLSLGPYWSGAIAPMESKYLDLIYTRDGYEYLTLASGGEIIEVYKPSGEKQEVTIKVELVLDISRYEGFVS